MARVFSPLWLGIGALAGAASGPIVRAAIFRHAVPAGEPWREACPACGETVAAPGRRGGAAALGRRGGLAALGRRGGAAALGRRGGLAALGPSGQCSSCRTRIGPRPGLVELISAAAVGLLGAFFGPHLGTLALAWAALVGVTLAFVDVAVHRLPDRLIVAGLAGSAVLLALATAAGASPRRLLVAVVCALAAGLVYFLIVFVSPRGMGLGDAKLAVLIGLATGWFGALTTVYGLLLGMILAGVVAIALLVARRVGRRDSIAYGPFMLLGALAAILFIR
jgi:leader peptidase (prepilin peptidase)/N-methyltransferase